MYYVIQGISLLAAIITIYDFIANKLNSNENFSNSYTNKLFQNKYAATGIFLLIVILFTYNYYVSDPANKLKQEIALERLKMKEIALDAKSVSDAIMVTGLEDAETYLMYIESASSFFSRYPDKFKDDGEKYKKIADTWRNRLNSAYDNDNTISYIWKNSLQGDAKFLDEYLISIYENYSELD